MTENAAKSSTRPGNRIIGKLLFAWSWLVAGALLLIFAPPVLLLGILFKRQDWIYWWANWGARNWLRLTGVKVNVTGCEHLDPNQTYVFVSNHQSYLDAAPLFAFTGRQMGMVAKKELLKAPILGYGMGAPKGPAPNRARCCHLKKARFTWRCKPAWRLCRSL